MNCVDPTLENENTLQNGSLEWEHIINENLATPGYFSHLLSLQ